MIAPNSKIIKDVKNNWSKVDTDCILHHFLKFFLTHLTKDGGLID